MPIVTGEWGATRQRHGANITRIITLAADESPTQATSGGGLAMSALASRESGSAFGGARPQRLLAELPFNRHRRLRGLPQ